MISADQILSLLREISEDIAIRKDVSGKLIFVLCDEPMFSLDQTRLETIEHVKSRIESELWYARKTRMGGDIYG